MTIAPNLFFLFEEDADALLLACEGRRLAVLGLKP